MSPIERLLRHIVCRSGQQRCRGLIISTICERLDWLVYCTVRGMKRALISVIVVAFANISSATAQDRPIRNVPATIQERIHPKLQRTEETETSDVIILYSQNAPPDAGHRMARRSAVNLHSHWQHAGVSAGRLTRREIERLASDPDVAYIAPDQEIRATSLDRGPESVGAYQAQDLGWSGAGIGVAIIDSGISYHNCDWGPRNCSNGTRYIAQLSFVKNLNGSWVAPDDGEDAYGHGTHVAGIVGGSGLFSTNFVNQWGIYPTYWIRGVAPGVNVISLRVLDKNGVGRDSSVIAAINYAIQSKNQFNIRVINLSLGRPVTTSYQTDPLCQAVERAWKAGIVVVVAAGNDGRNNSSSNHGYGTVSAPGNDPLVITVGALNTFASTDRSQHKVASYSSKGPTAIDHIVKPDLVAPGNNIYATQCQECQLTATYPDNRIVDTDYASIAGGPSSNHYLRLSGTSMATPVVSGAVALMLQKDPTLTPDQVKARLMKTATKANFVEAYTAVNAATGTGYLITHDLFTVGAGELDIVAALNDTNLVPGNLTAGSPSVHYDATTKQVKLDTGSSIVWGTSFVWGTNIVWGTTVLSGDSIVWGTSLVWGTSTMTGFNTVWGTGSIATSTGLALASESSSAVIHGDR